MDRAYIDSILQVILESNMVEQHIRAVELIPVTLLENGRKNLHIEMFDKCFPRFTDLSQGWLVSDLLLFTVFDGYLIHKYGLTEGASFKNHYQVLPVSNDTEIIQKDCYRIMKLIRNAVQHNLSSVVRNDDGCEIVYAFRGTNYRLKISKNGLDYLYTIIVNIVQEKIIGLYKGFHTKGHFEGIICKMYQDLCSEILYMDDEDGTRVNASLSAVKLEYSVRYPVKNAKKIHEPNKLVFQYVPNKASEGNDGTPQYYPTDYIYDGHSLPQEIGKIVKNYNNSGDDVIEFAITHLCNLWKIDS